MTRVINAITIVKMQTRTLHSKTVNRMTNAKWMLTVKILFRVINVK